MRKPIRAVIFVLWLVVTGYNLYIELKPHCVVEVPEKLLFAAAFVILWTLLYPPTKQHMKKWLAVLFLYYIWMLLNLLFFDAAFGREQIHYGINLKPFYTIRNYLRAYQRGYIPEIAMINVLGNLAAFAPMGFFLPSVCRMMGNLFLYFPTMFAMISTVEVSQVLMNCGSGDVDDLILNMAGALLSWLILWPVSRWINNRLRGARI